jgi:hypothetical protein
VLGCLEMISAVPDPYIALGSCTPPNGREFTLTETVDQIQNSILGIN